MVNTSRGDNSACVIAAAACCQAAERAQLGGEAAARAAQSTVPGSGQLWHQSARHRDVGCILPRMVTDARIAARVAEDRRAASAVLAEVYAPAQHEVVRASEAELSWTAADRG